MSEKTSKKRHSYLVRAIIKTRQEIEVVELIPEIGGGIVIAFIAWRFGLANRTELPELIFLCVGGAVIGAFVGFLIRLIFITPAKMHEELENKLDFAQAEIEKLRAPMLDIEGVTCDISSAQKHLCQIRILNKNSTITADNVKVELLELEDRLENSVQEQYFRPTYPIILNSQTGENIINPGSSLVYRLFHVMMNDGWFRQDNSQELIPYRAIVAYFTPGQITQNVTHFLWKKDYRLKLRVTARDFSKTEQDFNLSFSDEGKFCRFSLEKA
jgi:hypothetical protein